METMRLVNATGGAPLAMTAEKEKGWKRRAAGSVGVCLASCSGVQPLMSAKMVCLNSELASACGTSPPNSRATWITSLNSKTTSVDVVPLNQILICKLAARLHRFPLLSLQTIAALYRSQSRLSDAENVVDVCSTVDSNSSMCRPNADLRSTGSGTVGTTKEGLTSSKITSVGNKDDRDKKNAGSANSSRNLWVSGMSMSTKATDLKHLFSKYGRVIGAKVVTNARTPGARCYGYVTMANSEDASKCIQHLHRTELHGRMISVERAKGENGGPRKAAESKLSALTAESTSDKAPAADSQEEASEKKAEDSQDVERPNSAAAESASTTDTGTAFVKDNEDGKSTTSESKSAQVQQHGQTRDERFKERERVDRRPGGDRRRPPSPHRPRPGVLTFQQIREERERHRQREREREEREAERRRREEMARQREQERKQREEAIRLKEERERLRIERERLEREKAELMRLERERQRLEREKIEQEREELKRQQARELARLEEVRRATKRPSVTERDANFYDRKRMAVDAAPSARYSSSQSRFEESKSSSHYSSASIPTATDYRKVADRGYVDSRSRGERFDRTAGASSSSVVTRRVVEEVGPARRDARPPASPPRERDDRRVVERVRDDRYDRSSRGSGSGRDQSYSERDRERERERERERPRERVAGGPSERDRESARGRMDRDHRTDRYPPDSRSKGNGSDHRFGERSGSDGGWRGSSSGVNSSIGVVSKSGSSYGTTGSSASNALLGNGGAASHHNPRDSHHAWGAANDRNKTSGDGNVGHPSSVNTTTSWNSTTAPPVDRWGSSSSNLVSLGGGRAMTSGASFAGNWPNQSANPINSNVFTSNAALTNLGNVLGQSGSMNNYAADRYSRH